MKKRTNAHLFNVRAINFESGEKNAEVVAYPCKTKKEVARVVDRIQEFYHTRGMVCSIEASEMFIEMDISLDKEETPVIEKFGDTLNFTYQILGTKH